MIGERQIDGFAALTLRSNELEVAFVPEAGMVACSLLHRGEELLGQRQGLAAYAESGKTMGIPLLHPWANRLSQSGFELAGTRVELEGNPPRVVLDGNGLAIHGLLAGIRGWEVVRHDEAGDGGLLEARFDFGADPELMEMFPFAHELTYSATLAGRGLEIAMAVKATGPGSVPVSLGFHPYFRLPDAARAEWEVEVPVTERLVLDARMLPTGERESVEVESGPLGTRAFDDAFVAPVAGVPFVLAGAGRRIEVRFGEGYPYAQLYAPADDDVIAWEPMTAPANALVTRRGLSFVPPGDEYRAGFSISIS